MQKASCESDLTEKQWQALESLLQKPKKTGRPPIYRRWVLNAILHVLRTGCQPSHLPKDFPPKSTVHGLFRSWTKYKIIESIHSRLRGLERTFGWLTRWRLLTRGYERLSSRGFTSQ